MGLKKLEYHYYVSLVAPIPNHFSSSGTPKGETPHHQSLPEFLEGEVSQTRSAGADQGYSVRWDNKEKSHCAGVVLGCFEDNMDKDKDETIEGQSPHVAYSSCQTGKFPLSLWGKFAFLIT